MNISNSADIDRRRFFTTCAACAGALTAATSGCASLVARPVTAVNGVVRLSFANHPELRLPQGIVKILPSGERDPLFVLALGDDRFAVLSPICTHRGCTVESQGEHLVCPCHGSTYDRSGAVLRGPAERPLRRYATRPSGEFLEIDLRSPA